MPVSDSIHLLLRRLNAEGWPCWTLEERPAVQDGREVARLRCEPHVRGWAGRSVVVRLPRDGAITDEMVEAVQRAGMPALPRGAPPLPTAKAR